MPHNRKYEICGLKLCSVGDLRSRATTENGSMLKSVKSVESVLKSVKSVLKICVNLWLKSV